jgi:NAD-dependent DNA ligase
LGIKWIGPETIASVKQWFSNQYNKDILEQMAEKGVEYLWYQDHYEG